MNETQTQTPTPSVLVPTTEPDPLAAPGDPKEVAYPLLKPNKIYRFAVRSIEVIPVKAIPPGAKSLIMGATPSNVKITVATTKQELSVDDEPIESGLIVSTYIPCYTCVERQDEVSGKTKRAITAKDVRKNLLQFIFAVEGSNSKTPPNAVFDHPEQFIDKPVDCKVSVQEDKSGQYDPSNTIRFVIPD